MDNQIGPSTKKSRGLAGKTKALREGILWILERTGKPVSVRQLFYQCSVHGFVEKKESGYRKVQWQNLLMRRERLIPYDWVADNTRWMRKPQSYSSMLDFFKNAARFYRQDLWNKTDVHVEIWCEKDALAGVIYPITQEYDVPLMVTRGYSSESFTYESV